MKNALMIFACELTSICFAAGSVVSAILGFKQWWIFLLAALLSGVSSFKSSGDKQEIE